MASKHLGVNAILAGRFHFRNYLTAPRKVSWGRGFWVYFW